MCAAHSLTHIVLLDKQTQTYTQTTEPDPADITQTKKKKNPGLLLGTAVLRTCRQLRTCLYTLISTQAHSKHSLSFQ